MKKLLELYLRYFDFLYLDPRYRITDSITSGNPMINASLRLESPLLSWELSNDRGQLLVAVAPTQLANSPDSWFRLSLVRQYLDNFDETNPVSLEDKVAWMRDNLPRIEELFSDAKATRSCQELTNLAKLLADKYFGPSRM